MKTVVGLFSTFEEAQRVKQLLTSSGSLAAGDVKVVANHNEDDYAGTEHAGTGIGEKVSHFFKSLVGGDEDVHHHYAQGLNAGGALVTVKADDDEAQGVVVLLREHGARNIEGGAVDTDTGYNDISSGVAGTTSGLADAAGTTGYGTTGSTDFEATGAGHAALAETGPTSLNASNETTIPVVQEELVVGKREVERGGIRVYSHLVEEPISEEVSLRNETVQVERRPVDRVATAADFTPGERSFEVRAVGEEAVVGKVARVVEEVLVGKEVTQHTEGVTDTVRHTEVEVEQIPIA